jgi:hypothetical protein
MTMNADKTVTAAFFDDIDPLVNLTVIVNPSNGGTVTGTEIDCPDDCSGTYEQDTEVTLTANANTGLQFSAWDGCDSPNVNQCTMTMNADKTVTAAFFDDIDPLVNLTVIVNPSDGGTVTGTGIDCPDDCSGTYEQDTQVTLTVTENAGFQFAAWDGCDSPNGNQCTMPMNADKTVTATFFDDIDRGPHPVAIQSKLTVKKVKGAKAKTTYPGTITFNQTRENGGNFVVAVNGSSLTGNFSFMKKKEKIKKLELTFDQNGLDAIAAMLEEWIDNLVLKPGETLTNVACEAQGVQMKKWKFSSVYKIPQGKTKGKILGGKIEGFHNGIFKEKPLKWSFKIVLR